VDAAGLEYTCEISWSSNWHESILHAAEKFGADMLLIPLRARGAGERVIISDAKWSLLRNAHCGVLMIKPGAKESRDVVLAAMKVNYDSDEYAELNEKIGARARWMADRYGAELHVVTACSDIEEYPDRAKIIELTGVKNENIHVEMGKVEMAIPAVAKRLQADIVVVGTMARKGLSAVMRGNTSEKIISLLERDVMTLS
jgi:universal stress protein E